MKGMSLNTASKPLLHLARLRNISGSSPPTIRNKADHSMRAPHRNFALLAPGAVSEPKRHLTVPRRKTGGGVIHKPTTSSGVGFWPRGAGVRLKKFQPWRGF